MRLSLTLAVAAVFTFFTLQAAYWPLVLLPETKLHFWQMHWAAEIGYRIGAPVVGAILFSNLNGLTQQLLAIGLSVAWASAVAWVANIGIRNYQQAQKSPATHSSATTSPAAPTPTAQDVPAQTPAHLARGSAPPSAPSD